jgi:hypothetical protein
MLKITGIEQQKASPELVSDKKMYAARGIVQTRISVLA